MTQHHTSQELDLPAVLTHSVVAQLHTQFSKPSQQTTVINAGAVASFDSSALALLLEAKRSGCTVSNIPSALMDFAHLHGIASLLQEV